MEEPVGRRFGRSQALYDRFAELVDLPLTVLSLLWLPVLVLPYILTLSPTLSDTFETIDYLVWAAFVVEYLVKLYLSPSRKHFVGHHKMDLAVVALPVLRPLRAVRLLRLLSLARVGVVLGNALTRARGLITHRGLHFVLLAVLVIVFACSGLVLSFESHAKGATIHNFGDALWWAAVTVTTVGYGDEYPVTAGGRGVAVVLMVVGIGLIGALTATVASYFVEQHEDEERTEMLTRLDRMEAMLAELVARDHDSGDSALP